MNLAHESERFSDFLTPCERLHLTQESYFGSMALLPGWQLSPKCTEGHLTTTVKVLGRGEVQHPKTLNPLNPKTVKRENPKNTKTLHGTPKALNP